VTFPNVPNLPGVPPLLRDTSAAPFDASARLTADTAKVAAPAARTWGIYNATGARVLDVDSVLQVEFNSEYDLPTYPLEQGSFATYNKVEKPFRVMMRVARGGTDAAIRAFKDALDRIKGSLELFTVVTAQYSHVGVNVATVGYKRASDAGVSQVTADITLQQIRTTAATAFTTTAEPAGANVQDLGQIDTVTTPGAEPRHD